MAHIFAELQKSEADVILLQEALLALATRVQTQNRGMSWMHCIIKKENDDDDDDDDIIWLTSQSGAV